MDTDPTTFPVRIVLISERSGSHRLLSNPPENIQRYILNQLLIEQSWNSSHLEENTYSLFDMERLIDLNGHTILNLHALLTNNLLADPVAT